MTIKITHIDKHKFSNVFDKIMVFNSSKYEMDFVGEVSKETAKSLLHQNHLVHKKYTMEKTYITI
jgi:hypothetical protein